MQILEWLSSLGDGSIVPTDTRALVLWSLLLVLAVWLYTALLSAWAFPSLQDCHILLLIAHPDDEAMFFAPTVLNLTHPRRRNVVKLLCLSNGNADGLGDVRQKELRHSACLLGIEERHVVCLDEPGLQDSMSAAWAEADVEAVLSRFLLPTDYQLDSSSSATTSSTSGSSGSTTRSRAGKASLSKRDAPPHTHADVIITFDQDGVSSHPNHTSLFRGASSWLRRLREAHPGWACPVALYTLTSVPLWRKYKGVSDVAPSVLAGVLGAMGRSGRRQLELAGLVRPKANGTVDISASRPSWLLFVSGPLGILAGQRAMVQAHRSQMRWFRWGWIVLGRYMDVNDLRRVG